MKNYLNTHHRLVGFIATLVALVVAIIYLKVLPEELETTEGMQAFILKYGHSLCWFLLAGASSLWAIRRQNKWSVALAYLALATYLIFIVTLALTKVT